MTRSKLSTNAVLLAGASGLSVAAFAGQPAAAQEYCPDSLVPDPSFGCTADYNPYAYGYPYYYGGYGWYRGGHGFGHGMGAGGTIVDHGMGFHHSIVGVSHFGGGGFGHVGGGFHGGGGGHR